MLTLMIAYYNHPPPPTALWSAVSSGHDTLSVHTQYRKSVSRKLKLWDKNIFILKSHKQASLHDYQKKVKGWKNESLVSKIFSKACHTFWSLSCSFFSLKVEDVLNQFDCFSPCFTVYTLHCCCCWFEVMAVFNGRDQERKSAGKIGVCVVTSVGIFVAVHMMMYCKYISCGLSRLQLITTILRPHRTCLYLYVWEEG